MASKVHVPLLGMIAENDATTEVARAIDGAVQGAHRLIVYPPFHVRDAGRLPEGHMLFSAAGIIVWQEDALAWLRRYMAPR